MRCLPNYMREPRMDGGERGIRILEVLMQSVSYGVVVAVVADIATAARAAWPMLHHGLMDQRLTEDVVADDLKLNR